MASQRTRAGWLWLAAYGSVAAASLWLRSAVPVFAIGEAGHDDFLFVRLTYYLGSGSWLGPYNNLTLAKGVGYPAFILAAFAAGVPLKIAEQLLYLGACGFSAWLVRRLSGGRSLPFVLFAVLAFSPLMWTAELARVVREGIYGSLSMLLVMLAAAVLLLPATGKLGRNVRIALPAALGFVAAIYWVTREEGIWIAPALATLLGAAALRVLWCRRHLAGGLSRAVKEAATYLALALIVFGIGIGSVAGVNYWRFGDFATNEFRSAPFLAAYGALTRIEPAQWERYVVFPADARQKAYAVSPAALELRPALEGAAGESWLRASCQHVPRNPCSEILSAHFLWAFRDAVAAAGHYKSAPEAFAFYDRLAAEIDAACNAGRLSCLPPAASLAPPFRWGYVTDALAIAPQGFLRLARLGDGQVGSPASVGPHFLIALFAQLAGPVARTPEASIRLLVSVAPKADVQFFVRSLDQSDHRFDVERIEDDEAGARQFIVETTCLQPSCEIVVRAGASEQAYPVSAFLDGTEIHADTPAIVIKRHPWLNISSAMNAEQHRRDVQRGVAGTIAKIYSAAIPALAIAALVGTILGLLVLPLATAIGDVLILAVVCAVAAASRVGLMAYVDVSLIFGATNLLYLSPASPFLLMFVVLGLFCGGQAIASIYRRRHRPA